MKSTPIHVCAKTAFVGWRSTEIRRIISITSCPTIISLENALNYCIEKYGYGNFDHRYYVSPLHLYSRLGLGNFKQVVRVCAFQPPMKWSAISESSRKTALCIYWTHMNAYSVWKPRISLTIAIRMCGGNTRNICREKASLVLDYMPRIVDTWVYFWK
jgi:hypothetical protein